MASNALLLNSKLQGDLEFFKTQESKLRKQLQDNLTFQHETLKRMECPHKNIQIGGFVYTTIRCKDCGASLTTD